MVSAGRAGEGGAARDAVVFPLHLAVDAEGDPGRKPPLEDVLKAGIFGWEFAVEHLRGVLLLRLDGLVAVHKPSLRGAAISRVNRNCVVTDCEARDCLNRWKAS